MLNGHQAAINCVALSRDGTFAVTGSGAAMFQAGNDNSVRVWEIPTGKLLQTLPSLPQRVRSVAISGDGRRIAAGCEDQTVTLYAVTAPTAGGTRSADVLRTLRSRNGVIASLSFDQTGQHLLCGGTTLCLWDFGVQPPGGVK